MVSHRLQRLLRAQLMSLRPGFCEALNEAKLTFSRANRLVPVKKISDGHLALKYASCIQHSCLPMEDTAEASSMKRWCCQRPFFNGKQYACRVSVATSAGAELY